MTGVALALASLVLGSPPEVEVQRPGEVPSWSLDWNAPAECPTRAELIELVEDYAPGLEPPVELGQRSRLEVVATVVEREDESDPWAVTLAIGGPLSSQTRHFAAPSCTELGRATALIAAVMLEPVLVVNGLPEPEPEPTPSAEPEPPTAAGTETAASETAVEPAIESSAVTKPAEARVVASEDRPPEARNPRPKRRASRVRPQIGLNITGGGGYGPTDAGWINGGIGLAVFSGMWRWELDGGGGLAPRLSGKEDASSVPDPAPIGSGEGRFRNWWLGTRACLVPGVERIHLELPICVGIEIGETGATGIAPTTNPELQRKLWAAGSLGVGTNWVLSKRVALLLDIHVLVPVSRGDFVIDEAVAGSFAPVGLRAGFGFEVRL